MWIYIIIAIVFIYILYKERQALGCPNIPNGTDCDNVNGKAVKGSKCNKEMSKEEILNTIDYASSYQERWVTWRTFLMLSIIVSIIIIFILHQRFPSEHEFLVYILVLMLGLTLTSNFYKFHLTDHVSKNISEGVQLLKQ